MYQEHINFEIRPIFHPSMAICTDFARIDLLCLPPAEQKMLYMYKNLDKSYYKMWQEQKNVFAFAAYSGEYMIGFTTGFLQGKNMFTGSLYVAPEYQGYGIGSQLLNTSERAASLIAPNMTLFSLEGAVSFYQQRGYENKVVLGRILKIKKLSEPAVGIVPVFEWCDGLTAKLNVNIDIDLVKKNKFSPMFVYVNPEQRIDGVALRLPDGQDFIKYKNRSGKVAKYRVMELSDALYMAR